MSLLAYELVLHSITVLTILFQIYMFYLIQWQSPKSMINYKWYLNYFTICDLTFSVLMGGIVQPDPIGSMSFRVYGLASWLGPKAEMFSAAAIFYCGVNVFLAQDFCLLYRYTAILESRRLHEIFLSNRMKIVFVMFAQLFSIGIFVFFYNLLVTPEKFFDETFDPQRLTPVRAILEPGEFVLTATTDTKLVRVFIILTMVFYFLSEGFCMFLVYLILSTLRKNSATFSKNTYRLHFQLTCLLGIQLAIPLFLIIIPISFKWGMFLYTGEEVASFNHFRMALVTLYGLCNSIFTVIFVAPYRAFTYNRFIFPVLLPIAKVLRLKSWEPRRKSITWVSGTRRDIRVMTIAKTSVFLSD